MSKILYTKVYDKMAYSNSEAKDQTAPEAWPSPGRPTDIGLQLGKACYPCSR